MFYMTIITQREVNLQVHLCLLYQLEVHKLLFLSTFLIAQRTQMYLTIGESYLLHFLLLNIDLLKIVNQWKLWTNTEMIALIIINFHIDQNLLQDLLENILSFTCWKTNKQYMPCLCIYLLIYLVNLYQMKKGTLLIIQTRKY